MIVIADTTPLNYLILIDHADVLPTLYGRVFIPQAVYQELQQGRTPAVVQAHIAARPSWLEIRNITLPIDSTLTALDRGEQEAIVLAEELKADVLMIDDKDGRRAAAERNLVVIGTLGVLEEAAKLGLLDLPSAVSKLKETTFRADPRLLAVFLERDAQRKNQQP
jgi:predicted nucleic acid-binding protein